MSVTINLTEGNKVTIQRQDPISLTLEKKSASSVNIIQQANVAISLQNKAPVFVSIIKPGFAGSVTVWGNIAGTVTDQTDLVDYIAEQIAEIPTPPTPTLQSVTDAGNTTTNSITSQSISLDAENGGGIFNSAYSDVNILPKSNAFEFNVRTSSNTGKLRVSTDGALYLASDANALNLGKLYSGQYPKKQLQLGLTGSGYTAFYDSNGVNELMRVDGATGNVGIGTTAPSPTAGTKGLHLVAPTNQSSEIKLDTTDSDRGTYLTFAKAGVSKWDIYSPGDNSLRFRELQVPSSTPLTLLDGGNVGIGTTAPTEKLHVEGSIFIKNNRFIRSKDGGSTVYDLLGVLSNGHVQVGQPNRGLKFRGGGPASDIYFELAGSTQFILKGNTGNVGIGTTAPADKLEVWSNDNIGTTEIISAVSLSGSQRTSLGYNSVIGSFTLALETRSAKEITFNPNSTERMRITSDGNVGIGTTAPAAPLHVNGSLIAGTSTTSGLYFNAAADRLHISNQRVLEKSGASLFLGYNTNQLIFRTNNLERARFDVNGNLGIGTTTPAAKLHVSTTSGTAFKVNPNDTNREWYIDTTNPDHLKKGQNLILHADPTNVHTSTFISFNIDGSNKMHIQHDGAVGIGTTSPTSNLNINGSAMRQLRLQTSGGPSGNTDTAGNVGDIAYDDLYFYIKTTNGWGRVALDFAF